MSVSTIANSLCYSSQLGTRTHHSSEEAIRTTRLIRWIGTLLAALFLSWPAAPKETSHYTRFRDAKWYAIQLQSLQEEVAKIDTDLRTLVEARKSGKGITDAVALDQEP